MNKFKGATFDEMLKDEVLDVNGGGIRAALSAFGGSILVAASKGWKDIASGGLVVLGGIYQLVN